MAHLELVVLPADEPPPYGLDLVQDALHLVVAELLQHADRARAEEHLEWGKITKLQIFFKKNRNQSCRLIGDVAKKINQETYMKHGCKTKHNAVISIRNVCLAKIFFSIILNCQKSRFFFKENKALSCRVYLGVPCL